MASIRKRGENWHVQVRRKGARTVTRSFTTKGAASTFARKIEHKMDVARNPDDVSTLSKVTIGELIERYWDTVTPAKKGVR